METGVMEVLAFLLSTDYIIFTFSLSLALILGAISIFGIDFDEDADLDIETDISENFILDYFGFGRVPALLTITCLLGVFGLLGFGTQLLALTLLTTLPWWGVTMLVLLPTAVITRKITEMLANNMPNCETYASKLEDFIGAQAIVTLVAQPGAVGEAKLVDGDNTTHYLRVRFTNDVRNGDLVTLTEFDSESRTFNA